MESDYRHMTFAADVVNMVTPLRSERREEVNVPVYVPDTTTPAVLISEIFNEDGPHTEYADHWVRVGGMHCMAPVPTMRSSAA